MQPIVGLANRAGAAAVRHKPIRGQNAGIQREFRIRAPQASVLCQVMQIKVRQKPFLREIQRHGARQCRALLSRDAGSLVRAHVQAAGVLDLTLCQDALPESALFSAVIAFVRCVIYYGARAALHLIERGPLATLHDLQGRTIVRQSHLSNVGPIQKYMMSWRRRSAYSRLDAPADARPAIAYG